MWTANQQAAIDIPVADTIVSAAAGSGKTAVMAERIVKRVVSGEADIDRLLIVTFTNAAASEIKSRLMLKIMEHLDNSGTDNENLNRQLMLIANASICTIHSFCLNVIRNNFHRAGMDPNFKIADTGETELLKNTAMDSVFDEYYESEDKDFIKLVDCYTKKNDAYLVSLILKIHNFALSIPDGIQYIKNVAENGADSEKSFAYLLDKTVKLAGQALGYYDKAIELCSFDENLEKPKALLCDEKNAFEYIFAAKNWNDAYRAVHSFSGGRLVFSKKADKDICGQIKTLRTLGKDILKNIKENYITDTYESLCEDIKTSEIFVKKLAEITVKFDEEFSALKRSRNLVDFSDFEHIALKLLKNEDGSPSDAAVKLMEKFDEIYIDEYQDCNSVQEAIFSCISKKNIGKPNMFMVGDMKQSIYKFRDADPRLFKGKSDDYKLFDGEKVQYNKILLNKNFRSRKCVLDGVNSIFEQLMNEETGELEYTPDEFLYYNENSYEDVNSDMNSVDVVVIDENGTDLYIDPESESEELSAVEAEAVYAANRINSMVNSGDYLVFDKADGIYRPVKYSDIVILLRSIKGYAEVFNDVLTTSSIPVYCDIGGGYYDAPEIVFLINILKIIDNPLDDIALLSVMRHPVFGFTDNEFVDIRISGKKGYIYDAVKAYIRKNEDALSDKLKKFTDMLAYFYERSGFLPADKLIWEIVENTDYMAYLSFLPNSELKKANVRALFNRAYDFEQTDFKGIFNFVRYVDSLKSGNSDADAAKPLGDGENVVRIMSIHKSKGLEFPVVFLCRASKNFNFTDINDKVLLHKEYGIGVNYYDAEKRFSYPLPAKNTIKSKMYSEIISEEMRILYVALTRAREKLSITGSLKNASKKLDAIALELISSDKKINPAFTMRCKNYLEWILSAVIRNNSCNIGKDYSFDVHINDGSVFDTYVIPKSELVLEEETGERKFLFSELAPKTDADCAVQKLLEYEYPYSALCKTPSNVSVTELKKMQLDGDDSFDIYRKHSLASIELSDNIKPTAAEIGTYTHLVMEKLDFENTETADDVRAQIDGLVSKGFLTENNARYIKSENIYRLFKTELGRRMKENRMNLKREFSFKYLLPASEFNNEVRTDDKVVVQGMTDAYFEENGELVIVDYKTDRVDGNIGEIKAKYAPQLKYYKAALETALNKKVKQTYLFLLDSGDVIEV